MMDERQEFHITAESIRITMLFAARKGRFDLFVWLPLIYGLTEDYPLGGSVVMNLVALAHHLDTQNRAVVDWSDPMNLWGAIT